MKLQKLTSIYDGRHEWRLIISQSELETVKLQTGDRMLFQECESSDRISDKLLALETLVRRIEGRVP
jgi:hypothetical protein